MAVVVQLKGKGAGKDHILHAATSARSRRIPCDAVFPGRQAGAFSSHAAPLLFFPVAKPNLKES